MWKSIPLNGHNQHILYIPNSIRHDTTLRYAVYQWSNESAAASRDNKKKYKLTQSNTDVSFLNLLLLFFLRLICSKSTWAPQCSRHIWREKKKILKSSFFILLFSHIIYTNKLFFLDERKAAKNDWRRKKKEKKNLMREIFHLIKTCKIERCKNLVWIFRHGAHWTAQYKI